MLRVVAPLKAGCILVFFFDKIFSNTPAYHQHERTASQGIAASRDSVRMGQSYCLFSKYFDHGV